MKIIIYTLILISILSIFKPKNLKNKQNPSKYQVLVLGDNGEYRLWNKEYNLVMKDPNLKTVKEKTQKIFGFGKTEVKGAKCFYTPQGQTEIDFTNELSAKEYGMKNFNDVINSASFKLLSEEADNIVFLGDIVYVEAKRLNVIEGDKIKMLMPDQWTTRLKCAWNMFVSQLVKLKLHTGAHLADKVDILPGNHSFDVNFKAEDEFNDNYMQKQNEKGIFYMMKDGTLKVIPKEKKRGTYNNIRKLTVKVGERLINFVDFNSAVLLCMHPSGKTAYDKCGSHKYYQTKKWKFTKALEYYTALVHVVKSLEPHAWNVMRAHHPPTNFEDGDPDFYWAKLMDNMSLIDLFKLKKVRMFFGSHIHTQAVMALPYKDVPMREKSEKDKMTELGAYCNEQNVKFDASGLLPKKLCEKNTAFVVDTLKEDVLLIFIVGNSGRNFDPISTGTLSTHGNIIWARKNKLNDGRDAFGFSNVIFRIEEVQFEFYEIFDTKEQVYESKKVAEVKITEYKKGPGA